MQQVTAILNSFSRPDAIKLQVDAIRNQSVPATLMAWSNNSKYQFDPFIVSAECSKNLGVWARFAFALNAKTPYVCVFDDDIVPGPEWFRNCIETLETHNGLLGGHGAIFRNRENYREFESVGWRRPNETCRQVDIVGNAWFFRREWLSIFWSELPSLDQPYCAGEDFHFSWMMQRHGMGTYVPPHPRGDRTRWSSPSQRLGRELSNSGQAIKNDYAKAKIVREGLQRFQDKGFRLLMDDPAISEVTE